MSGTGVAESPKLVGDVLARNAFHGQPYRTLPPVGASLTKAADAMNLETVRANIVRLLAAKGNATPSFGRKPSPAAERMRRSRERRRDKLRVIPFEIRDTEIGGLVARGLLDPVARNDRNAVANALGRLFDAVPPERWPVPPMR